MNARQTPFSTVFALLVSGLLMLALAGCSTFDKTAADNIDCSSQLASCHKGRFGLVWKTVDQNGKEEGDSISGTYEWRALPAASTHNQELAFLEVNSTLGPTLGTAKRTGDFYEVRAADGRVYLAQDWQTLFDLMFPVKLPANALIQWMNNPNATNLPQLPPNWTWEVNNGRYRVVFVEKDTTGRIDLIPQNP